MSKKIFYKKALVIVVTLAISLSGRDIFAQQAPLPDPNILLSKPGASYFDVQQQIKDILNGSSANGDKENKEIRALTEWDWFWGHRLNGYNSSVPGGFDQAIEANKRQIVNPVCNSLADNGSNWKLLGPVSQPANSVVGPSMGIVVAVAHNPRDVNTIYIGTNYSGCWQTTNGGKTWKCITDSLHLPWLGIHDIKLDPLNPDIVFIATQGQGVLKYNNATQKFVIASFNGYTGHFPQVYALLVHHVRKDYRIYAALDNFIWKSTDGGLTFDAIKKTELPILANNGWNMRHWRFIKMHPTQSKTIYLASDGQRDVAKIWMTTDDFKSQPRDISFTTSPTDMFTVEVSPAAPNDLWAGTGHDIKKYSRGKWTALADLPYAPHIDIYYNKLVVSPTDADVMYFCYIRLWKNTDGKWVEVKGSSAPAVHDDKRAIDIIKGSSPGTDGTSDEILLGTDGGMAKSFDGGASWSNINGTGLAINQFYGLCSPESNPNIISGGTQDNGFLTYHPGHFEGGNNWSQSMYSDGYDCECDADFANNRTMYGSANSGRDFLVRSIDGGDTWGSASWAFPPPSSQYHKRNTPIISSPADMKYYIAGHDIYSSATTPNIELDNSPAHRLSDFTGNPQTLLPSCQHINCFAIAPSDARYIYAAAGGPVGTHPQQDVTCKGTLSPCTPSENNPCLSKKLFRSRDGGANWTDITGNIAWPWFGGKGTDAIRWFGISAMCVSSADPDKIWIGYDNIGFNEDKTGGSNRVNFSSDGGASWKDISAGLPPFPVNKLVYRKGSNDELYAATDAGVFYTNAGLNFEWQCFNNFFPACIVTDLEINHSAKLIRAATYGRGIWESPLATR